MRNNWIMTVKAGNRPRLVSAVTCLIIPVIYIIAGHIGSGYTVDHGRSIIVTADAPFLFAGQKCVTGKNAGSPVCLGTDTRMINSVIGAAWTVAGIADIGGGKVIAVQEIATGSHTTGNVTGSIAGQLRAKGV
jgi:hypothetical protein